jgi:hypothetical protein
LKGQGFDPTLNKELVLSISTIPSIPVCRQAGMLGLSNGVNIRFSTLKLSFDNWSEIR